MLFIPLFFLTGYYNINARTNPDLGNRNIHILKAKIKNKLSFPGEINFRSEKAILTFNYGEYKDIRSTKICHFKQKI